MRLFTANVRMERPQTNGRDIIQTNKFAIRKAILSMQGLIMWTCKHAECGIHNHVNMRNAGFNHVNMRNAYSKKGTKSADEPEMQGFRGRDWLS